MTEDEITRVEDAIHTLIAQIRRALWTHVQCTPEEAWAKYHTPQDGAP